MKVLQTRRSLFQRALCVRFALKPLSAARSIASAALALSPFLIASAAEREKCAWEPINFAAEVRDVNAQGFSVDVKNYSKRAVCFSIRPSEEDPSGFAANHLFYVDARTADADQGAARSHTDAPESNPINHAYTCIPRAASARSPSMVSFDFRYGDNILPPSPQQNEIEVHIGGYYSFVLDHQPPIGVPPKARPPYKCKNAFAKDVLVRAALNPDAAGQR